MGGAFSLSCLPLRRQVLATDAACGATSHRRPPDEPRGRGLEATAASVTRPSKGGCSVIVTWEAAGAAPLEDRMPILGSVVYSTD